MWVGQQAFSHWQVRLKKNHCPESYSTCEFGLWLCFWLVNFLPSLIALFFSSFFLPLYWAQFSIKFIILCHVLYIAKCTVFTICLCTFCSFLTYFLLLLVLFGVHVKLHHPVYPLTDKWIKWCIQYHSIVYVTLRMLNNITLNVLDIISSEKDKQKYFCQGPLSCWSLLGCKSCLRSIQ